MRDGVDLNLSNLIRDAVPHERQGEELDAARRDEAQLLDEGAQPGPLAVWQPDAALQVSQALAQPVSARHFSGLHSQDARHSQRQLWRERRHGH
jgi:hypothetical protein